MYLLHLFVFSFRIVNLMIRSEDAKIRQNNTTQYSNLMMYLCLPERRNLRISKGLSVGGGRGCQSPKRT